LPFLGAFAGAVLLTVMSVIGLGGELESDAQVGADHDVDVDADADVGADHDLDVDAEAGAGGAGIGDGDHDVDVHAPSAAAVAGHDAAASALSVNNLLYFFGIGKVPLSMLLIAFGYAFGTVGWAANSVWQVRGIDPNRWFTVTLVAALCAGLLSMRFVGGLVSRYLPTRGVSGFARKQLIGLRGTCSLPVNEKSGQVQVVDAEGTLHQLRCRVGQGSAALAKSTPVILVKYEPQSDFYYVVVDRKRR
jgi:hypothetical protein